MKLIVVAQNYNSFSFPTTSFSEVSRMKVEKPTFQRKLIRDVATRK